VKIKGKPQKEGKTILYFAHLKDSLDCAIKTNGKYSKEEIERIKYNGAKESVLHWELKNALAAALEANERTKNGVFDVKIEQCVKNQAISKEWKKPDVQCNYWDKKMVFELQLSTTFLSVIVEREMFYKQHKIFILWVFNEFNLEAHLQKFTQKDILYSNNRNAFLFSAEAQRRSIESNDLILQCWYLVPRIENERITSFWELQYVRLSDLIFDPNEFKVYYFDSEKEFLKLEKELEELLEARRYAEKRKKEIELMEQEKREIEQKKREIEQARCEVEQEKKNLLQIKQEIEQKVTKEPPQTDIQKKITDLLNLVQDFYETNAEIAKYNLSKGLSSLKPEEVKLLNEKLYPKTLWKTLGGKLYSAFSEYMLFHPKIDINPNQTVEDLSAFKYICLSNIDTSFMCSFFFHLVNKGYDWNLHQDGIWIKQRVREYEILSKTELERTILMKYIWQLKKREGIQKLNVLRPVIFSLLSFKLNRILGSNFINLLQVAHNAMDNRKDFSYLVLKIIRKYNFEEIWNNEKFQKKVKMHLQSNIAENHSYDDIFQIIMPDVLI
jgi:hypothetical protein